MQAILTRTLPCTEHRPTRIKATCERGSIVISWPEAPSCDGAHRIVAQTLCKKFVSEDAEAYGTPQRANPWRRPFVTGCLPGSLGFAHVFKS